MKPPHCLVFPGNEPALVPNSLLLALGEQLNSCNGPLQGLNASMQACNGSLHAFNEAFHL